ncbi:hypothetical protein QE430_000700 [Microbacterium testaceum]|nr:hypothetical protein [Microbacterium testaceum]
MLLHSIVFASRCARVQAEFLATEVDDETGDDAFVDRR